MATAHDVAAYILRSRGEMTTLKLHLLAYYAQAWSLVWDERPLFADGLEAWSHGPVVASLYPCHASHFRVSKWPEGDPGLLSPTERETLDAVLDYYGPKSTPWLGQLARGEQPWLAASRARSLDPTLHPSISLASIAEYYSAPY